MSFDEREETVWDEIRFWAWVVVMLIVSAWGFSFGAMWIAELIA